MTLKEDFHHSDTELSPLAQKLVLHGDNDSHLHHTSTVPIRNNLNRKIRKGVYDHEKAKKLWGYHADRAAQAFTREHGQAGQKWHQLFPPKVRREAAAHWADEHHGNVMAGELTHVHKEEFAAEIVYAAMERKATDAHVQFKDAVLERSREIVEDRRIDLHGKFSPALLESKGSSFMARFRKGAK